MKRTNTTSGKGEGRDAPGFASPNAVLLQVHLWAGNGASGADVPPPALAMVADLLQVRGGELRDAPAGSIAASFPDAVLAVNAARNLQRLVQGFSRAWQDGALGGCSTLVRIEEAKDAVDVASLRGDQALKQTHPGQVIFVGGLCDAARSVPGLEFRPIALGPAGKNGAVRQALQLLPPLRMEGFVEEPFEPKVVEEAKPAPVAAPPVSHPIQPVVPAYVLVSSPPSGRSAIVPPAAVSSPASGSMRAVQSEPAKEVGAFAREEKTSGKGLPRWMMLGGAAAAVLVGVLIFALRKSPTPAPEPAQQQAEPAQPAPATVAPVVGTTVPAGNTTPPPPVSTKAKGNEAGRGKAPAHTVDTSTPPATIEPPPPPVETHSTHSVVVTPAEINLLISHADKDSGNGNFDKAIQEYHMVLSREPSNELAKRGLAKALYNKEHQ